MKRNDADALRWLTSRRPFARKSHTSGTIFRMKYTVVLQYYNNIHIDLP
jgi:hypothetical protein